jgi:hypothetical protein
MGANVEGDAVEALTAKLRPPGSSSLLDRLRTQNSGKPRTRVVDLNDPGLWARIGLTDDVIGEDEAPEPAKVPRKRTPSATRYIKQARRAGERGPVSVEMIDDDGRKVVVTSSEQPEATPTDQAADAERAWLERIARNAAH